MDYEGELPNDDSCDDLVGRPHSCRDCGTLQVSPHCFSINCAWVRCSMCGAVTGFLRGMGQTVLGSFRNPV